MLTWALAMPGWFVTYGFNVSYLITTITSCHHIISCMLWD